ncbi:MAG: T9SS type A sorting domain-containing protein [bacterium]|nr:T9SS type A sorting domain-containing protein [bacterium]
MTKKILLLALLLKSSFLFSQILPDTFLPRGMGGGGALFFPTINPINEDEFYVSCDMSQMFHTTNYGKTYTQIHHKTLQVFNTSTYEYTYNDQIAYSNHNDGNSGYPVKTTDGGKTWKVLTGHNASYGQVYRLIANYNNPNQVVIGYYGDIYITNNGGTTLNLVKHATNNGVGIILAGAFFDGTSITIATNEGLFKSTNSGVAFAPLSTTGMPAGEVIWNFKGAKNGGTSRFVCISSVGASTYNGIMPWDYNNHAKGIYTMDNANGKWTLKTTGLNFSNDFVMYVGMADNDINTFYLGGHDNALSGPLVYKTNDGGSTYNKVFQTTNNQNIITGWSGSGGDKNWSWGETCFGITVAPNNSNKVIFPDFSFVHVSSDGGATWRQAYTDTADEHLAKSVTPKNKAYHSIGIENTTAWQMHWLDSNNVFAAFSDIGGISSKDGGKSWGYQFNGLSVNSVYRYAQSGTTLFAATSGIHDMYQSTRLKDAQLDAADAQGKIYFSIDKGDNWSVMHSFGHPVYWLATDPNRPNTLYASVIHYGGGGAGMLGGIYVSNNINLGASATFTKLPNPPRTEGHPASINVLKNGQVVCTFSARYGANFTASSGVFIYDPTSNTWTDKSDANMQYWTKDLVIDPSDTSENTWYVGVFSGWGGSANNKGGLYRTTDKGTSWTKLSGSLFDRVTSISFNPIDYSQAFVSTETQGLYVMYNLKNATPSFQLVNSYIFRQPERIYFNPYKPGELWITSFGNGLKVGHVKRNLGSGLGKVLAKPQIMVYPNPASAVLNIVSEENIQEVALYDLMGKQLLSYSLRLNGNYFMLNVQEFSKGIYLLKVNETCRQIVIE